MNTATSYQELSREELVVKVSELTHRLNQLERLIFGSKHERFIPTASADQLALDIMSPLVVPPVASMESIQYERKKVSSKPESEKVHTGRMPIPASLPREQIIIEPNQDVTG